MIQHESRLMVADNSGAEEVLGLLVGTLYCSEKISLGSPQWLRDSISKYSHMLEGTSIKLINTSEKKGVS